MPKAMKFWLDADHRASKSCTPLSRVEHILWRPVSHQDIGSGGDGIPQLLAIGLVGYRERRPMGGHRATEDSCTFDGDGLVDQQRSVAQTLPPWPRIKRIALPAAYRKWQKQKVEPSSAVEDSVQPEHQERLARLRWRSSDTTFADGEGDYIAGQGSGFGASGRAREEQEGSFRASKQIGMGASPYPSASGTAFRVLP